mmetsp:Transcript_74453/g.147433  ORF Transcript_74453/g.147433 Transcript_74453/m.147433 type:complete len:117 (-) Transcript_74453:12-362(-)
MLTHLRTRITESPMPMVAINQMHSCCHNCEQEQRESKLYWNQGMAFLQRLEMFHAQQCHQAGVSGNTKPEFKASKDARKDGLRQVEPRQESLRIIIDGHSFRGTLSEQFPTNLEVA